MIKNDQCYLVKRRRASPQFNLLVLTNSIDDFYNYSEKNSEKY